MTDQNQDHEIIPGLGELSMPLIVGPNAASDTTLTQYVGRLAQVTGKLVTASEISQVRTEGVTRELKGDIKALDAKIDGVKTELKGDIKALDAKIDGVRTELKGDIKALDTKIDGVRTELKGDIKALDTKIEGNIKALDAKIDGIKIDLRADLKVLDAKIDSVSKSISRFTWFFGIGVTIFLAMFGTNIATLIRLAK
jgi:predicted phage-related endonuclease